MIECVGCGSRGGDVRIREVKGEASGYVYKALRELSMTRRPPWLWLMPDVLRFARFLRVDQGHVYPIVGSQRVVKGWYVRDRGFYSHPHPASWRGREDRPSAGWMGRIVQ